MHLTDPHLFAEANGELRGVVTASSLQRVLDHYEAGDWRADRVLVTGDLIQDDSDEAYQRFCELLAPLNLRIHCVPGNHDVRARMRSACERPPFSYCASETVEDWLLVGMDSCVSGTAGGEVVDEELTRVENVISSSESPYAMVFLHHPPVDMGSAWLDTVKLANGDEVLHRLRALNKVQLLLFGHVHQPYDAMHNDIQIVGTPSTCRQFKQGSDDFAVDERPPAYRRLQLGNDGSSRSELIWVEERESV